MIASATNNNERISNDGIFCMIGRITARVVTNDVERWCRCQGRADMLALQFLKMTTHEMRKSRHHQGVKKNKIRSLSDVSEAVYPRQPPNPAVDESNKTTQVDGCSQSPPVGDDSEYSDRFTTTNVLDSEQRSSTCTLYAWN